MPFWGAETGDLSELSTATNCAIESAVVSKDANGNGGNYSWKVTSSSQATCPVITLPSALGELYVRAWFYPTSLPAGTASGYILSLYNSTASLVAAVNQVGDDSAHGIIPFEGNVGSWLPYLGQVNLNAWNLIEIYYKKGTGANSTITVFFNSSQSSRTNLQQTTDITSIRFCSPAGASPTCYWDDIRVEATGPIGAGYVIARRPNAQANPTYDGWTKTTNQATISGVWSQIPFDAISNAVPTAAGAQTAAVHPHYTSRKAAGNAGTTGITYLQGGAGTWEAIGFQFTPGSYSGPLSYISIALFKVGAPTDNVYLRVYTGNFESTLIGTSVNVPGAQATKDTNGLTDVAMYCSFKFATPFSVVSGNTYYAVVARTGARDTANHYGTLAANSDNGAGGNVYKKDNGAYAATTQFQKFELGSESTDAINAVKVALVGKRGSGSSRTHNLRFRYNGTDYDSPDWTAISTADALFDFYPTVTSDQVLENNVSFGATLLSLTSQRESQSFTASYSGWVTSLKFWMYRSTGASAGNVVLSLRTARDSGEIASTSAAVSSLGTVGGVFFMNFASPVFLTSGVTYYIVWSITNDLSPNGITITGDSVNQYVGTWEFYNGTSWSSFTGDMCVTIIWKTPLLGMLNASEIGGVQGTGTLAQAFTIEDCWLMADYTPAAAPAAPSTPAVPISGSVNTPRDIWPAVAKHGRNLEVIRRLYELGR